MCAPFPHGYKVSRGVPVFPLGMTECVARNENFLSITCPKGKYHCESNITVEDNITAKVISLPKANIVAAGNINKKPLAVARGFQTENYC